MAVTSHVGLTLVEQAQAQKEVTVNEALKRLDALLNGGALDKDLATPPGSPAEGDVYIVAASATDDWAGEEDAIAYFDQVWRFITPREGMALWVADEDQTYVYDGSGWSVPPMLGIGSAADSTNRLTVASEAVLFTHDGDDVQIKVNKNATGDTASYLFQTGFSGRAEFGLIGEDDFALKVSPDGSNFYESFKVDRASGNLTLKKLTGFGAAEAVTIASGAVTVSQSYVAVDTESAAASDDLETINGGSEGQLLVVCSTDDGRDVVLKDGLGNLSLAGDMTLVTTRDRITLLHDGTRWIELSRSSN